MKREPTADTFAKVSDELTTTVALPFRHRVRHGGRRSHSWFQLGRFVTVGASGYVVNLAAFAARVHLLAMSIAAGTPLSSVAQKLWSFRA